MIKIPKPLYGLLLGLALTLHHAHAKEGTCTISANLKLTSYHYIAELAPDEKGALRPIPLLDPDGNPVLNPDGTPRFKLRSPLTIDFLIEGTYTITHKDGAKSGPHQYGDSKRREFPFVKPPENITQALTEIFGMQEIENIKKQLEKESCEKNGCTHNN